MTRRSSGGLSPWWPTPARPSDHFTAQELERSAGLHRPLRRIRAGLVAAELALLIALAWLLGTAAVGLRIEGTDSVARALVGAAAVVIAVRLPETIAGRRVRRIAAVDEVVPGRVGAGPARAVVAMAAIVVPTVVLAAAAWLVLGPLTDRRWGWLVVPAIAAAVVGGTIVATGRRGRRAPAADIPAGWEELVRRSGPDGPVGFGLLAEDGGGASTPNACALSALGRRWILIDPSLQAPSTSTLVTKSLADFVVAHELTHLARRHPEIQLVLHGMVVLVALAALPTMAMTGWPWSWFGLAPDDPLSLPVAALVMAAGAALALLPVSWLLRALERIADAGAVELVGLPEAATARALHLAAGADLAPSPLSMLVAVRPSPAQRLEYLDRRRAFTAGPRPGPRRPRRPHRSPAGR